MISTKKHYSTITAYNRTFSFYFKNTFKPKINIEFVVYITTRTSMFKSKLSSLKLVTSRFKLSVAM